MNRGIAISLAGSSKLRGTGGGQISRWLRLRTGGPHSHARNPVFKKNKRPTSVAESYKTTNGHKTVVLMSVVGNGSFLPDDSTKYRTSELP